MKDEALRIGERIKALRLSKLMTQQELAGGHITRNMLSTIEHGTALPSLPTAIYLAARLGVPVGYLLADEHEEEAYRKMLHIENIRHAYRAGDFSGCLSMLGTVFGEAPNDDELQLIRAQCEFEVGRGALFKGWLRYAAAALDRALIAAEKTLYETDFLRSRIAVFFRYLGGISGTVSSDVLDVAEVERARADGDLLAEYIVALEEMENGREDAALRFVETHAGTLHAQRVQSVQMMRRQDYTGAQALLETMLSNDELTFGILLYEVIGDLEVCYRKNDDYKRAYEFSGSRLGLLERLLEEV